MESGRGFCASPLSFWELYTILATDKLCVGGGTHDWRGLNERSTGWMCLVCKYKAVRMADGSKRIHAPGAFGKALDYWIPDQE